MDNSTSINQALKSLNEAIQQNLENIGDTNTSIKFKGKVFGKGLIWSGNGHTKQFILSDNPEGFFSSESIDLAKNQHYSINKTNVLSEKELGPTVQKSNLKELGRLKGLIVDGSLSINQNLYYDANTDKLGIGTPEPNSTLSVVEDGVEVIIGSKDYNTGVIGTFASHNLALRTDNKDRILIDAFGNIDVGMSDSQPISVKINGKLAIGVANPDPNVDLHVKGSVRFNDRVQMYGTEPPGGGFFNEGDIVWNKKPQQRKYIGWVCTRAGNPGIWNPFGEIR